MVMLCCCFSRVVLQLMLVLLCTTTTTTAAFVIQSPSSTTEGQRRRIAAAAKSPSPFTAATVTVTPIAPTGSRTAGISTVLTRMNAVNNNNNNGKGEDENNNNILVDVPIFALKLAVVLTVKVAKDLVNYPPMLFEQVLQQQQQLNDGNGNNSNSNNINSINNNNNNNSVDYRMSPVVMLAKFCGVLVFKGVHDAFYFPMVWTQDIVTDVEQAAISFRSSSKLLENEYRYMYNAPPPEVAATFYLASLWIENLCVMLRDQYHSNGLF